MVRTNQLVGSEPQDKNFIISTTFYRNVCLEFDDGSIDCDEMSHFTVLKMQELNSTAIVNRASIVSIEVRLNM